MSESPNRTDAADSLALVAEIVAADPPHRVRLIQSFLLTRDSVFNRLSFSIARKFAAEHARDDLRQIIMIEAHAMITEAIEDPDYLESVDSFEGMLAVRSHARSRTYLDRDDIGVTNVTTILRRRRMLMATREQMMLESGGEVSDNDVVDAHNKKVTATRVNAQKQGMIATVSDMRQNFAPAADSELAEIAGATTDSTGDHLLHPLEGRAFVTEIIRRCDLEDTRLGEFARAWLEAVYFDGDEAPNERDLAKAFSITKAAVAKTIVRVRAIALDALHETLDIGEDDVSQSIEVSN